MRPLTMFLQRGSLVTPRKIERHPFPSVQVPACAIAPRLRARRNPSTPQPSCCWDRSVSDGVKTMLEFGSSNPRRGKIRLLCLLPCRAYVTRWHCLDEVAMWAICFIPGILGVLLSIQGCRHAHKCKPEGPNGQDEEGGVGNYGVMLPGYLLLLVTMVVALAMHTSALLHCEVRTVDPARLAPSHPCSKKPEALRLVKSARNTTMLLLLPLSLGLTAFVSPPGFSGDELHRTAWTYSWRTTRWSRSVTRRARSFSP